MSEDACTKCGSRLMFSARKRRDGLCGPCHRSGASKSFYVASSRDGLPDVMRIADFLLSRGWTWSFDWPSHFDHACGDHCGIRDRGDLMDREIDGAAACDLFVGVSRMGKGTHVELGSALLSQRSRLDKRVVLIGADEDASVFYVGHRVVRVDTVDDFLWILEHDDWHTERSRVGPERTRLAALSGSAPEPPPAISCHGGRRCRNWPDCEFCGPPRL